MKIKDILPYIEDYIISLVNTRHFDEKELFEAVAELCQRRVNRLTASDPDRNR